MITIVPYGPDVEKLHTEFALRFWKKRKRTTPEYIYWKFRGVPGKELYSFILAMENGIVIGQLGLVPCVVKVNNRLVEAQWACDLMVDHAYRGKGIAKLLYDFAYSLRPLTLGSDASPAATISMKRAGFKSVPGPWKFIIPLSIGEIFKVKGVNNRFLNRLPYPWIYILIAWRFFRPGRRFKTASVKDFVVIMKRHTNKYPIHVLHNLDFAEWRYRPFKDYYSGLSLYGSNNEVNFSVYKGKEIFFVTEYAAQNIWQYLDIISEVVFQAYKENVSRIKFLSNSSAEKSALILSGGIKFRRHTDIIYYTVDQQLNDEMSGRYFYYTQLDSDENI